MSEKTEVIGLTGIDALEAEMRDRLAAANKAHEKTRAYLGAEINSKAELRNRLDIYVTEANRALTTANEEINLLKIEKKLSNLNADRGFDAKDARIAELEAALTPSEETKFAYMGEVNFWHTDIDEDGNEHRIRLDVPWTSIKVLMKLIRQKADERAAHRAMIKAEKEQGE